MASYVQPATSSDVTALQARVPAIRSPQQHLRYRRQTLFDGRFCRRHVLGLHDHFVGFPEKVLSHGSLHALAPCVQFGTAFKDVATGTDGLWIEGAKREGLGSGEHQLRKLLQGFLLRSVPRPPPAAPTSPVFIWIHLVDTETENSRLSQPGGHLVPPCPHHGTHMHQLRDGHQVSH